MKYEASEKQKNNLRQYSKHLRSNKTKLKHNKSNLR
jgi:hypothetical protein